MVKAFWPLPGKFFLKSKVNHPTG